MRAQKFNGEQFALNVIVPPAAQTDSSFALVWEKPEAADDIECYEVYVYGELFGRCRSTVYTVTGLTSSQVYEVYVKAVFKKGGLSFKSNSLKVSTKPKSIAW